MSKNFLSSRESGISSGCLSLKSCPKSEEEFCPLSHEELTKSDVASVAHLLDTTTEHATYLRHPFGGELNLGSQQYQLNPSQGQFAVQMVYHTLRLLLPLASVLGDSRTQSTIILDYQIEV